MVGKGKCERCNGTGYLFKNYDGDLVRCRCNPPVMIYGFMYYPEDDLNEQEAVQSDFFSVLGHTLCEAVGFLDKDIQGK